MFLVTKDAPRGLSLQWLKEKQKREGGQTCTHEDIHSWESGGKEQFRLKALEVAK